MKLWLALLLLGTLGMVRAQETDSLALNQVDSLIKVSRELTGRQEFEKALAVNAAAERIALETFGPESVAYGTCCFNQGRVLYFQRDFTNAEKWYLESRKVREKALGKEHPDYAWSLNNLAILYDDMGQYEKAEPLYIEARAIREKALGKEHPDYVSSLNNLANLYMDMGQYEKAEPLYIEARIIREKTLGKEHPEFVRSLTRLALLYYHMGKYEKAEPLYVEAKAIREKVLGKEHPDYTPTLINLGANYLEMGLYEKAESLFLEARAILAEVRGKDNLEYAFSLNNLAGLYQRLGHYEKVEPLFLEAKAIMAKVKGEDNLEYAASLNNLSTLYYLMGLYEKAESLFLDAKIIWENVLGKEHPMYATSLQNLASLYADLGQYEKAESLYLDAKTIWGKSLGMDHPHYARTLNDLAALYADLGLYDKAEPLYIESSTILELSLGKGHPDYAASLTKLAALYTDLGQLEKAESLHFEAETIRKNSLGRAHPHYAQSLSDLADVCRLMNKSEKAESYHIEASAVHRLLMEKALLHLSERDLNDYLHKFSDSQDRLLSFAQATSSPGVIPACYDNSLFYKGFLLQAADRLKQLALSDQATTDRFNQLKGYRRRLAAQYAKPIAERDSALVVQLETQANDLEKDLARSVAGFAEAQRQVNWQEVQAALPGDAVALEFVHFRDLDTDAGTSMRYAALLLGPGAEQPLFIPLFEEKELDHLLDGDRERKADYVNELYALADRGTIKLGSEKQSLYELIWAKIEESGLEGITTVYYSPSGVLHRLNLGAIAVDEETILSDKYHLVALNSTRQLVIPSTVTTTANDALLVGGVNFEMDSVQTFQQEQPLLASRAASEAWTESGSRGGTWSYLKWTEKEVERIATSLTTGGFAAAQLSGSEATEEAIKAIGKDGYSPRVLHLATHGFFFPDPEIAPSFRRGLGEAEPVFKSSDNPMIRSGLILAGGNYAWQHGRPVSPDREDGILTAYEISQMNLSNTELVVLSACETGLGDIRGNEGVYGLQRAFKIAGAKYLIISLWQVPDRETMEFMTAFYRNWLEEKFPIPEAFRKTQREMRDRFYNSYSGRDSSCWNESLFLIKPKTCIRNARFALRS